MSTLRGSCKTVLLAAVALGLCVCSPIAAPPVPVNHSTGWGDAEARDFYSADQGSRLIPLVWMQALTQPDGKPFLADSLARYGYLPNPASPAPGLPVGFVAATDSDGTRSLGLTCAACHTRDITVGTTSYRIDGGPALSDFGRFLTDLDVAVQAVLPPGPRFSGFAAAVLGSGNTPDARAKLATDLQAWAVPYHTITAKLHDAQPWGVGRLDAVTMIFNRVSGLDVGPPENNYLIPGNIQPPIAPARYPFLWNAAVQDRTQWPGFATNGSSVLGTARNLGEVLGVFARFHPKPNHGPILKIDYLANNASPNFGGLDHLEDLIRKIPTPSWPQSWPRDASLVSRGQAIYTGSPGCADCHWLEPVKAGVTRGLVNRTWCTPVIPAGTDIAEWAILERNVDTGVLAGASIPGGVTLDKTDTPLRLLTMAVTGSLIDHFFPPGRVLLAPAPTQPEKLFTGELADIPTIFTPLAQGQSLAPPMIQCGTDYAEVPKHGYEARALFGIWAAAPYLHNGSVPTLADLLEPSASRPASFAVGAAYDPAKIGLAAGQPGLATTLTTTGCEDRLSGNSRCGHEGHEYGTDLSPDDKKALLEFLKTL